MEKVIFCDTDYEDYDEQEIIFDELFDILIIARIFDKVNMF